MRPRTTCLQCGAPPEPGKVRSHPPLRTRAVTTLAIGGLDLAAYLAASREGCVHVRVGDPRPNRGNDLVEFPRGELLAGRGAGHDVRGPDHPSNRATLRIGRGPHW